MPKVPLMPDADKTRTLSYRIDDTHHFSRIFGNPHTPLVELLTAYLDHVGFGGDHLVYQARSFIDQKAKSTRIIEESGTLFGAFGRLTQQALGMIGKKSDDIYHEAIQENAQEVHEILPATTNLVDGSDIPASVAMVIQNSSRPAISIYHATGATLFVAPFGVHIYHRRFSTSWPSGATRPFTRKVESAQQDWVPSHLVVIQDRFDQANFAHFLFDAITRIGHFAQSGLAPIKDCVFVMGGVPGAFQEIVLEAASRCFQIQLDKFLFPTEAVNLMTPGRIFWFSDLARHYLHPAQMAHPSSLAIIRKVSEHIQIEASRNSPAIYISRKDASQRRLSNEDELWPTMASVGFRYLTMSDYPVEEQIGIVRGAQRIIGVHGMGLTHLSLHLGSPSVLELMNPEKATDAFAFMARGMAMPYSSLPGTPAGNAESDFEIGSSALFERLRDVPQSARSIQVASTNLIEGSSSFCGRWGAGAQEFPAAPSDLVSRLFETAVVMRHIRGDSSSFPDSNCGFWWDIPIEGGQQYTASCYIWLPADFVGEEVAICVGEWSGQTWMTAHLSSRNRWQRISSTAFAPVGARSGSLVLRINSASGTAVFSTGWQLELGSEPTDYRPTGQPAAAA